MTKERTTQYRRSLFSCEACFHPRIVGHAFTKFRCEKCSEEKMYPNTGVPRICSDCCKKLNVCCRCGKPMD